MKRFVFASNNAHKLAEVREIMPVDVEVLSLRDVGFLSEIEENGLTLAENSRIKAQVVYDWLQTRSQRPNIDGVFADDTGLEIDALNGEPGVYTARWYAMGDSPYAGVELPEMENYAANRAKALRMLAGETNRGCQFRTVITLITPKTTLQVDGIVRGIITTEEHGTNGFGYDSVFMPEGYDKTFGELPAETKNAISHRGRALAKLVALL